MNRRTFPQRIALFLINREKRMQDDVIFNSKIARRKFRTYRSASYSGTINVWWHIGSL